MSTSQEIELQNVSLPQVNQELSEEDKIVKNALLFIAIYIKKPSEEKSREIQKHLNEGADVNAKDANNRNNTPLHIAVLKGEPDVVQLLLKRGAIIGNKNSDDSSPLDIAELSDTPNSQEIVNILKEHQKVLTNSCSSVEQSLLVEGPVQKLKPSEQSSVQQQSQRKRIRDDSRRNEQKKSQLHYSKRAGTSGLSGQLYETKLLALILFRALNDKKINDFYLGTNVDGIGALDDITLRYNLNGQEKQRVKFIQAKHKDNSGKERVTVTEVQKKDKDFSLNKYLDSYLRIKQRFNPESDNDLFKGNFSDIDCEFVIYTTAEEDFSKKKVVKYLNTSKDNLIYTSETGKTFQYEYEADDINVLVKTASESRTKLLAESLAKFVLSDKHNHTVMMSDELIKTYHVVLAQKVVEVFGIESGDYRKGKFRPEFFSSNEDLLSILRKTLYKETVLCKSKLLPTDINNSVDEILKTASANSISKLIGSVLTFDTENKRLKFIEKKISQDFIQSKNGLENLEVMQDTVNEAIDIARKEKLKSLSFKLPVSFGNLDFKVKKEKRLKHLTSKLMELLTNACTRSNIVKIDDNMVGHGKMLTDGDIAINGGIGGLVGNLLILDEETNMMKFSNDEESLPEDAKQLFENLKREILECENLNDKDLRSYKFEINVQGFPRLSVISDDFDKNLVEGFLDNLWFYTNQAKENEVETILKEEIYEHYKANKKQDEYTFRITSEAIFLKFHDEVQKWWKQPETAYYLTKSCTFFDQAEKDVIDSPLLTTLNFIYVNKFKKNNITFNQDAIQTLELDKFTSCPNERILNIITEEHILSSVKIAQYFENKNSNAHTFMDLDYVSRTGCYKQAIFEFKERTLNILLIGCKDENINVKELYRELKGIVDNKSKKIILLTKRNNILAENFKKDFPNKYIEKSDDKNNLINLTAESQKKLLDNSKVIFQGEEVNLGMLIDQKSRYIIDEKVLLKLINDEKLEIGETITSSRFKDVKDYYIDRTFSRNIKIKEGFKKKESIFFISGNDDGESTPHQNQDIVLISDVEEDFKKLCDNYREHNIHWLKEERNEFLWQQSHGVLHKLREFVCYTNEQSMHESKPKNITDIPDRVVIIAAEPGMGKSIVLTPLALKTNESDPSLWVVRINLLDQSTLFEKWKEDKTAIYESLAIKFLYGSIIQKFLLVFRGNEEQREERKDRIINNILEHIESNGEIALKTNEENKIKGLNVLEVRLFYDFYKQGKIALLFDGFDEISPDYKDQVIKLLVVLKKTNVEKIWITTRPYHIQSDLENKLGTFSYALKPFLEEEQRDFLMKFWKKNLKLSELDEQRSTHFIKELLLRFSESANDQERGFVGIPLQISMIAKVFQDTFKEFYDSKSQELSNEHKQKLREKLNLNTLYKRFIKIKFYEILFGEKESGMNTASSQIKKMIKEEYEKCLENHRKLALFEDNKLRKLLSIEERREIHSLIESIEQGKEKTGIITGVINGNPNFIHRTFTEYFVASYLWEKIKSIQFDKIGKDFIKRIIINNLIKDNRIQICKFFQLEAQKDLENDVDFSDKEGKLKTLLATLDNNFYDSFININQSTKLLLKIIDMFLSTKEGIDLEIIRNVVQGINDDKILALLCVSAEMGYMKLADAFVTLGQLNTTFLQKYLKHDRWDYNPVWLAAKNSHLDIVQILVKKLSYDTTWKDKYEENLFQRIIHLNQFNVLRSCLKLDIIDVPHSTYYGYNKIAKLPLLECISGNAPLDVIKLLIQKTDFNFVNQFKINRIPAAVYVIGQLFRYDKKFVSLLVEKGIDFNAGYDDGATLINIITFEFKYSSILLSIPQYYQPKPQFSRRRSHSDEVFAKLRNPKFSTRRFYSDNEFSNFFNFVKFLLEYGAIYNLEDRYGNTILQNVKQMQFIHKLFKTILQTADKENYSLSNLLENISKKVLQLMIKSPDVKYSDCFQGYKISIDSQSNKIAFLTSYDNVKYQKRYRKPPPMKEIFFVPEYIQSLFFDAYKNYDTECTIIKDTLDILSCYIKVTESSMHSHSQKLEIFTSTFNSDTSLLKRVEELSKNQNYVIDEAFAEVSEEALKFRRKIQYYVKILPKLREHKHQKKVYKSVEVLTILGIEDFISKMYEFTDILDLVTKINESEGIYFLNEVLLKLNDVGEKNKKEILESIVKFTESSQSLELLKTTELLKTIDDLFDAINSNHKESVVSILQNADSSFKEAAVNVRNKQKKTLLDLAYEAGNVEIINLLRTLREKYKKESL